MLDDGGIYRAERNSDGQPPELRGSQDVSEFPVYYSVFLSGPASILKACAKGGRPPRKAARPPRKSPQARPEKPAGPV